MPVVSVHMPVFNAERFLAEAVESILHQTFTDFEFIIVDDGSTDGSAGILGHFADRDRRIHLVSRSNKGITRTRNEALQAAKGEFFAVMDADDVALPERLEKQVAYLRANPECVAVGCRVLLIDAEGAPIRHLSTETAHEDIDRLHLAGQGGIITHPAAMMRRQALLDIGGYRERFQTAEDLDVFLRLAESGRLANLPDVLLHYRQHLTSTCHTRRARVREDNRAVIQEARSRRGLSDTSDIGPADQRDAAPWEHHCKWTWWALEAGFVPTARKHAWAAVRKAPFSSRAWRAFLCAARGH